MSPQIEGEWLVGREIVQTLVCPAVGRKAKKKKKKKKNVNVFEVFRINVTFLKASILCL